MTDTLAQFAIELGDDSLILGHRLSEWCSRAPMLEEDIALSNVALDFIGRARLFYQYAAQINGQSEDEIAYFRDDSQYTNLLINELPIGDFAFTMARQFLIDSFDCLYFKALTSSTDEQLAAIAAKVIKECEYHLKRSSIWVLRLGDGTEESHQRIQHAINRLWAYCHELFLPSNCELVLQNSGVSVERSQLQQQWQRNVTEQLRLATIDIPQDERAIQGGRNGIHTEHLGFLLAEMQVLQRNQPNLVW